MTKKLSMLLLAAIALTQVSMAQFHVGFKGGANITKIDGKSFKDEFSYGYVIAGFAEIGLGSRFSINPEVQFNQFSGTVSEDYKDIYQGVFNSDQSKVKMNYLSIPLVLDYKLLGPLHIQAGPQFSILMNKDKNFLENGADAFKKGDFALVGGAQIHLRGLRVGGRYVLGLDNMNDIDNKDQWRSQAWQLTVGFAL